MCTQDVEKFKCGHTFHLDTPIVRCWLYPHMCNGQSFRLVENVKGDINPAVCILCAKRGLV
jgi:hypothetical protein